MNINRRFAFKVAFYNDKGDYVFSSFIPFSYNLRNSIYDIFPEISDVNKLYVEGIQYVTSNFTKVYVPLEERIEF